MLFSIIVPIYKVEKYLEKCVSSLRNQTFREIEIILVDDGSPDGCPDMCDQFAAADDRIRVIHKKNGGLSDARNAGLAIAQGEYVFFVDSDDYLELDACERFSSFAAKKYDILIGEAIVEGGQASVDHIAPSESIYTGEQYLLKSFQEKKDVPMAACINVYRRAFLRENDLLFKIGILHEDEQFTPRVLIAAQSVVCTGIPFYRYMIRNGSITTKPDKRKNANDFFSTCIELEQLYKNLKDAALKDYLLDSLTVKYLNIFQTGKLHQYGDEYLHKDLVWRNACLPKTRIKAALYCANVRVYYLINLLTKKIGRK